MMMKRFSLVVASMLALLMSGTTDVQAERYSMKAHKMTVAGTSTLHDWKCPATKLNANGDISMQNNDLQSVNSLWVDVESKSIKSDKDAMDEKIYEALKAESYEKITFQMSKMKSIEKKGDSYAVIALGNLTIAGVVKPTELTVTAKVLPNGDVEFSGSKTMRMTQFNVDPPTAMWGVIKAGDEITIAFTLTMKKG